MTPRLTILVPALNEAPRLPAGMERFAAAVADGAVDVDQTEVVVVDDGSTDGTADTARRLLAHLPHHRVITLPANGGKGAAVRTGVALARTPLVAYMDADMAIDPRAVPALLEALGSGEAAIGSRALVDSMVDGTYAVRAVMGRLFNRLVTTGTGLGLQDTQCGFKAFRTPAARLLFHLVRHRPLRLRRRAPGPGPAAGPAHHRGPRPVEERPREHHPPPPRLGDHAERRLPLPLRPARPPRRCPPSWSGVGPVATGSGSVPADRIAEVVADTLDGAPVPVVVDGRSVVVLLPLVEPAEAATVFSALRAEFDSLEVTRRAMSLEALAGLGSLAGRLRAASEGAGDGMSPSAVPWPT